MAAMTPIHVTVKHVSATGMKNLSAALSEMSEPMPKDANAVAVDAEWFERLVAAVRVVVESS